MESLKQEALPIKSFKEMYCLHCNFVDGYIVKIAKATEQKLHVQI